MRDRMMPRIAALLVVAWGVAIVALTAGSSSIVLRDAAAATQGALERGAKVTFERVLPADRPPQVQSQRSRLLSLAVERGEVPSPFLELGYFRATYRAIVTLPSRDRYRFRIAGRGKVKLTINGKEVLAGALRERQPLETKKKVRLKKGGNDLELEFESSAFGDGQFRLYWAPPECGFEPIAPELLSWAADDAELVAGERRQLGQELFLARRCARCHGFEQAKLADGAFGELAGAGPDLRGVGARLKRDWLAAWLQDPTAFRHDATMPGLGFTAQDAADAATFLAGLGEPAARDLPADGVAAGRDRFLQLGCVACHVPPDRDRKERVLGDRLALHHVPQKWHAAALVDYLRDPQRFYPHVRMPDFRLTEEDAVNLAAYLLNGKFASEPVPLAAAAGDAARGQQIVADRHCASCHEVAVSVADRIVRSLRELRPDRGCLADAAEARGDAPDHRLSAEQRAALREFLPFAEQAPFRKAPLDYAERQLTAQRCTACHGLDDRPSVWATVANELALDDPLPPEQDPVAQGIPSLTWVGSKLQPSWMSAFVQGQKPSPRPWLTARMPAFEHRGAAITSGLVREHGYGSKDEPLQPANAQMAIHGNTLLQQGTGFGCVQCHALGDKPAEQVFEREGIELHLARQRLRHEYYIRWLLDPPRIDPEARMPKYANSKGKTAFVEILGGDAEQQFEAIWQSLGGRK
ncbi:MAG: c-type cytochrome [bacterium]|nr:c-type cytochrome [bacterium]